MKRAFIYTRVSTLEQAKEGYSIKQQEHRLKAYAEAKGMKVIKVYSDPGFSGAKKDRPALKEMIKNISSTDVVLVYKLDRLSRSQKDTLYLIEEVFLKNGVDFISLNESFDTSTSFGRAMIGILSVFAQLEREQMIERFSMGREGRAKSGKWYGGGGETRMITGYDYKNGELVINEYEAACVRMIFDLKTKKVPPSHIWDEVQAKFPGVLKSPSTINRIASNKTYLGKIPWKGKIYEGNHEPIINQEVYDAANSMPTKKRKLDKASSALLSNVAVCGYCGSPIYGSGGYKRKDGTFVGYYGCRGRRKYRERSTYRPECKLKPYRRDKLDPEIVSEIQKINISDVEIAKKEKDVTRDIEAVENKINKLDKQSNKLIELFSIDGIDFESINNKIAGLNKEKLSLQKHIEELKSSDTNQSLLEDKIKTISKLDEVDFDNLEMEKKRLIVAKLINKITLFNDYITIDWAF